MRTRAARRMAAVHPRGKARRRAARRQQSPAAAAMMGLSCQMTMSKGRWRGSSCEFWSGVVHSCSSAHGVWLEHRSACSACFEECAFGLAGNLESDALILLSSPPSRSTGAA